MRYLTVRKFSSESGYTGAAIRSKISDGTWVENRVWRRAPDKRILIDVSGYESWVEGETGIRLKKHPPSPTLKAKASLALSPPPFSP